MHVRSGAQAGSAISVDEAQTVAFREWLQAQIDGMPQSLHAIEVTAGIPGNGLGKFLRGERGARHSLTPLNIRRLAPIIRVSEEEMLARAGHLSHQPDMVDVKMAILADPNLNYEDKRFMLDVYRRVRGSAA